jgi:hypothetical protein
MEGGAQIRFPALFKSSKSNAEGAVIANNNSQPAQGMRRDNTGSDLRQKSHTKNNTGGAFSIGALIGLQTHPR